MPQKRLKLNCWAPRRIVVAVLSLWALALPAEENEARPEPASADWHRGDQPDSVGD